jgi:hypothetical protein
MAGRVRFWLVLGAMCSFGLLAAGVASPAAAPKAPTTATAAAPAATAPASPPPVTFAIADDAAQRAFPSELASAHGIGFGAARAYVSWADIATRRPAKPRDPKDPAYDWTQTDADMARYGAAGLAVWVAFWQTPAWASGSSDTAVWATNPSDLGDFAFAVAKRYPQVKVFMDWNEPNLKAYATPNTIAAYEPMARAVYAGVKAATPTAEVIAGNLGHYRDNGRDPAEWATALHTDGVPMDVFGIHPYPDFSKPLADRSPRLRIDLFDVPALARIVGVPVAVTEFGWSSETVGLANQAAWTAQAIDVARCTPGLAQFVFWGYHDHPVPAGQTPDPWVSYGWLDASGAPKPVYAAGAAAIAGTPDCATIAQTAGAPAGWPDTNTIPPTDTAPACTDVALSAAAGGTASADLACTDADGDPLGYAITTQPANGSLSQSGSVFTYAPSGGFSGADSFTVAAADGTTSTPITVNVSVTAPVAVAPPPAPPVITEQALSAPVATPVVAPAAVTSATVRVVNGRATLEKGVVSLALGCVSDRGRDGAHRRVRAPAGRQTGAAHVCGQDDRARRQVPDDDARRLGAHGHEGCEAPRAA